MMNMYVQYTHTSLLPCKRLLLSPSLSSLSPLSSLLSPSTSKGKKEEGAKSRIYARGPPPSQNRARASREDFSDGNSEGQIFYKSPKSNTISSRNFPRFSTIKIRNSTNSCSTYCKPCPCSISLSLFCTQKATSIAASAALFLLCCCNAIRVFV